MYTGILVFCTEVNLETTRNFDTPHAIFLVILTTVTVVTNLNTNLETACIFVFEGLCLQLNFYVLVLLLLKFF